ncbi:MAG: glycosyl transferase family 4 [Nanoarchaeota archaeon]
MNLPNPLLFIPLFVAFWVTYLVLPGWIKKARKFGLTGKNMNKLGKEKIAEAGGITVIAGFVLGAFIYIAIKTFYFSSKDNLIEIFSLISVVLIFAFIGIVDDLLGWKKGLSRKFRLFLCLFASVPLIVINAGNGGIDIPFIGVVNAGFLYPLVLIPIGVVGASTTFNFLAGYNGLEAGQGILILSSLSLISYLNQDRWLALIGLCLVFSLIAFWIFNKFPARVLPGDVITYPIGGLIAIMAIFGGIEKIAFFFFIPYILEVVLKLRGRLEKQSFGKPNRDGSLDLPYDKIYGLEHLAIKVIKKIKGKVYEKDVVFYIHLLQLFIILLGFFIFRKSIFV